jgi:hypothetical protein
MNARQELAKIAKEHAKRDIARAVDSARCAALQTKRAGRAKDANRWDRISAYLAKWEGEQP